MGQRRTLNRTFKIFSTKQQLKYNLSKLEDAVTAMIREKLIALNAYIRKE